MVFKEGRLKDTVNLGHDGPGIRPRSQTGTGNIWVKRNTATNTGETGARWQYLVLAEKVDLKDKSHQSVSGIESQCCGKRKGNE